MDECRRELERAANAYQNAAGRLYEMAKQKKLTAAEVESAKAYVYMCESDAQNALCGAQPAVDAAEE